MQFDQATGLYYDNARYYDSSTGRFLSTDPIGFVGGDWNLYRYVGNNPITFNDPSGKSVGVTYVDGTVIYYYGMTASEFTFMVDNAYGGTIQNITITGHATSAVQDLGGGGIWGFGDASNPHDCIYVNSAFKGPPEIMTGDNVDITDALSRALAPSGSIDLNGCNTGVSANGSPSLAQDMARALPGHAVTGKSADAFRFMDTSLGSSTTFRYNPPARIPAAGRNELKPVGSSAPAQ